MRELLGKEKTFFNYCKFKFQTRTAVCDEFIYPYKPSWYYVQCKFPEGF